MAQIALFLDLGAIVPEIHTIFTQINLANIGKKAKIYQNK